jgi:hypothetical protein
MAEYYRLRFRKEGEILYAARGSKFDGCPDSLWYAVRSPGLANKFRKPSVIHRVMRGAEVFRDILASGALWEIVHCSERVVESGAHGFKLLRREHGPVVRSRPAGPDEDGSA